MQLSEIVFLLAKQTFTALKDPNQHQVLFLVVWQNLSMDKGWQTLLIYFCNCNFKLYNGYDNNNCIIMVVNSVYFRFNRFLVVI